MDLQENMGIESALERRRGQADGGSGQSFVLREARIKGYCKGEMT